MKAASIKRKRIPEETEAGTTETEMSPRKTTREEKWNKFLTNNSNP